MQPAGFPLVLGMLGLQPPAASPGPGLGGGGSHGDALASPLVFPLPQACVLCDSASGISQSAGRCLAPGRPDHAYWEFLPSTSVRGNWQAHLPASWPCAWGGQGQTNSIASPRCPQWEGKKGNLLIQCSLNVLPSPISPLKPRVGEQC